MPQDIAFNVGIPGRPTPATSERGFHLFLKIFVSFVSFCSILPSAFPIGSPNPHHVRTRLPSPPENLRILRFLLFNFTVGLPHRLAQPPPRSNERGFHLFLKIFVSFASFCSILTSPPHRRAQPPPRSNERGHDHFRCVGILAKHPHMT